MARPVGSKPPVLKILTTSDLMADHDPVRWLTAFAAHVTVHDLAATVVNVYGWMRDVSMSPDSKQDRDTFAALARWASSINADRVSVSRHPERPHVRIYGELFGMPCRVTAILERAEAAAWAHSEAPEGALPMSVLEVSSR